MENRDFKYVLQDITNIYIGARLSYRELLTLDEVPFKLKAILSHYMLREVADDTRIQDHIFFLDKAHMTYVVYKQMKARFRLSVWQENRGKKGPGYVSRTYRIEEIVDNPELNEKKDEIIVEELHLTRLGLMGVSI